MITKKHNKDGINIGIKKVIFQQILRLFNLVRKNHLLFLFLLQI